MLLAWEGDTVRCQMRTYENSREDGEEHNGSALISDFYSLNHGLSRGNQSSVSVLEADRILDLYNLNQPEVREYWKKTGFERF